MFINDWEHLLARHFRKLERKRALSNRPTFSLEHGLSDTEVRELNKVAQEDLRRSRTIIKYPLTWVVYASEVGYRYSGGEFWQTFQAETSGWEELGDRHWVKSCFQHFRDQYHGAQPSGPWARHRTIICWPIFHAILPQDLQRQLAKVLYKARHSLDESHFDSPAELGNLIAVHGYDATSRFKWILQEKALIGQIATALLQVDSCTNDELILRLTLQRIRKDLDRERQARNWLRKAQQHAKSRAQLRGLQGSKPAPRIEVDIERHPGLLRLKPRLELRAIDNNFWIVSAEFPDYSTLLELFPDCREPLTSSRVFVEGSSGRPIPPCGLLYGGLSKRMQKWPPESKPLLRFEKSNKILDDLLQEDCMLSDGPWVFKLKPQGNASQIVSRVVRQNEDYVILFSEFSSDGELVENDMPNIPGMQKVTIDCEEVLAFSLSIGDTLSEELQKALYSYGIQPARQLRVIPTGVIPTRWDGEGEIEWLSIDEPVISFESNYLVKRLEFELIFGDEMIANLTVNNSAEDDSIFLQLPRLDPGLYYLHVRAVDFSGESEAGRLDISIRNPVQAGDMLNARGALLLHVYPPNPTLEELWEGAVSLEVIGPESRQITCTLVFYERSNPEPLFQDKKSFKLPITSTTWTKQFAKHWHNNESCAFDYGAASECRILFEGSELGYQRLDCERSISPLRWAYKHNNKKYEIRLIDDTEVIREKSVNLYSFDEPDVRRQIEDQTLRKFSMIADAGLYVATVDDQITSIVVPPEIEALDQLRLSPKIEHRPASVQSICEHLELLEYWANARLANVLIGSHFRNDVVDVLVRGMFRMLGGERWYRVENSRIGRAGNNWRAGMIDAVQSKMYGQDWGETIIGQLSELANAQPKNVSNSS